MIKTIIKFIFLIINCTDSFNIKSVDLLKKQNKIFINFKQIFDQNEFKKINYDNNKNYLNKKIINFSTDAIFFTGTIELNKSFLGKKLKE